MKISIKKKKVIILIDKKETNTIIKRKDMKYYKI